MGPPCCCLLLLLFLVPAALAATCTTDPCSNACTGCAIHVMVSDPEDCQRYYICDGLGGLLFNTPFDCPAGTVFDATTHKCDAAATCTPCSFGTSQCSYDCNFAQNNMISFLYNCSMYYDCNGVSPADMHTCPSTAPYFDGAECQTNPAKCCSCLPYCYKADLNRLVPDPKDCRKFYACISAGEVPTISGTCTSGQYFVAASQGCSSSAPCDTLCKNVVGSDGCIDPYTCEATGYFPKCPSQCTPEYYHCTTVSDTYIEAESCESSHVFHPDTHSCVTEDKCP